MPRESAKFEHLEHELIVKEVRPRAIERSTEPEYKVKIFDFYGDRIFVGIFEGTFSDAVAYAKDLVNEVL